MFVTSQPGRIVLAKKHNLAAQTTETVGAEGLFSRITANADGIIVAEHGAFDSTAGYALAKGEVLEFSGLAEICNSSSSDIGVSILIFDTV